MKLSIRLKFLLVMSGLLLVCLGFYLLMSVTVFKTDKTQLVYDLNRSQVSNLASELETNLSGLNETLNLYAQVSGALQDKIIKGLFHKDSDIVALYVFKRGEKEALNKHLNNEYFETYGITEDDQKNLLVNNRPPLDKIRTQGEALWNASSPGTPPLMGYGKRVLVLNDNDQPVDQWILVSLIKIDHFLKSLSQQNLSDIQVSNRDGEVLIQKDVKALIQRPVVKENMIFKKAIKAPNQLAMARDSSEGENWLWAYAKAYGDRLIITAKAPEQKVFQVVKTLTVRTLLFGSIVLTLVMLAAVLVSRSLTQNIALLARRMTAAAKGDLSTHVSLKGRDETVKLGEAFNQMIFDLKKSRDELEIMNKELDQKVKERTQQLEIQNRKVVEAQEALLRTTRLASMGEVAGRTAHEVLNPLTSLLTRAGLTQKRAEVNYQQPLELLSDLSQAWQEDYQSGGFETLVANWQAPSDIDPSKNLFSEDMDNVKKISEDLKQQKEEISKDMQFIREEGDRISKIIHSMRRLGNLKSSVRPQSIHQLLDDCFDIMADLFAQYQVQFSKIFSADDDQVKIDRDEFIQSITNLMRNSLQSIAAAHKEREDYQGTFSVETQVSGQFLLVIVQDNGCGVRPEHQDQLFQANFTTKEAEEGTGIGLSISRRFIRAYDGDIQFLQSQPFVKTIFEIKLPLNNAQSKGKAVA